MADLPITSDEGATPVVINDPTTTANVAKVDSSGRLNIDNSSWIGSTAPTIGQKTMANSLPVTMASDQTPAIPMEDYVSRFTKANQVYQVAMEATAATANTDNPILLLRNPSGSGKVMYLRIIRAGTITANVAMGFKIFANPTVTVNGTSQTPTSANIGGGAPASVILATSLPTVTSNGSELDAVDMGQNSDSVEMGKIFVFSVQANNSLLFTASPSSNNRNVDFMVQWAEL